MKNPLKRVRSYYKIKKAADKLLDGIEQEQKLFSKSIFKSRTFWVNLLALLNELLKILPLNENITGIAIPSDIVAAALPPINIVLRKLTRVPVRVISNGDKQLDGRL